MKDELTIPRIIKVLVMDHGEAPQTWGIVPSIKAFQSIIAGDIIFHVMWDDDIVAVTDADAAFLGFPLTFTMDGKQLHGPIVFTKVKDGQFVSLSDFDILDIMVKFKEAMLKEARNA